MTIVRNSRRDPTGAAGRAALLVIEAVLLLVLVGVSYRWSSRPGKGLLDYGSFVASGDAANQGLNPYGVYRLTFRVPPQHVPAPNLNPPISVYPFRWLARLDPAKSARAWYVLSLGGFMLAVGLLARAHPQTPSHASAWAFALAGLWHTLELGQIYIPLLLCAAGAWLLLREGDNWRAGPAIGVLVALKPQFAIWPALLFCGGHVRSALSGAAIAGLLSLLPLLVDGPAIYAQWLAASPPVMSGDPLVKLAGNSSILGVASRAGLEPLGAVLTIALVLLAAAAVRRARMDPAESSAVALLVAVLVGPISWPGYILLLVPVIFFIGWRRATPAVVLLSFPFWGVLQFSEGSPPVAFVARSVYFFGAVALGAMLWRVLSERLRAPERVKARNGPV